MSTPELVEAQQGTGMALASHPLMFWVYELYKDRLFSLKGFPNQADAIAYADKTRDDEKLRGETRHYEVHLGKQVVYTN